MRHQISPVAKSKKPTGKATRVAILPASLPESRLGVDYETARAVPIVDLNKIKLFHDIRHCPKNHRSSKCQNFKRQDDQILCSAP
jgi:hypothetical protein